MTTIIVPTAIVTGMGLIAAVILTVASKLMYVPVDERVAAIREVLPGANCGACGFAGCDDYAAAFTDNPGLSCSLCPVGGASDGFTDRRYHGRGSKRCQNLRWQW